MRRRSGRTGPAGPAAMLLAGVTAAVLVAGCGGVTADGPTPAAPSAPVTSSPQTPSPAPPGSPATPPSTDPSTTPEPAPSSPPTTAPDPLPATPAAPRTLGPGDAGPAVLALQHRLAELGYWLGTPDGSFGLLTTQAVLALQGTAGIDRDGRVGPRTRAELDAGTTPRARSGAGRVTEIDLDRGLVMFVDRGRVTHVLHTSTGTFDRYTHEGRTMLADTPRGRWTVTWAQDGWRDGELGELYRPRYFHSDGVAVHGYPNVPAYPASHGCARVTLPAMDMIWARGLMPKGSAVWVY